MTCEQVGEDLGYSGPRISRIETGKISATAGDVLELLAHYGVTGPEAEYLVQLAREAREKGWWHTYGANLPGWFEAYVGFEAESTVFRDFQPSYIPGLLQTEDYARAVLHASPGAEATSKDRDRQVELRMKRQGVLSKENAPEFWFVISESALRIQIGSSQVATAQLRHLAELAARPNVTVQILPSASAAHVNPVTGFRILEFPDPRDPTIVYVEHLTGALFLEREDEIRRYTVMFDHLRAEALGINPSIDLINQIADSMG